jgi:hypothetical protein
MDVVVMATKHIGGAIFVPVTIDDSLQLFVLIPIHVGECYKCPDTRLFFERVEQAAAARDGMLS